MLNAKGISKGCSPELFQNFPGPDNIKIYRETIITEHVKNTVTVVLMSSKGYHPLYTDRYRRT